MATELLKSVKDRSRGIGGSDVGSLFGLNKWMPLPKLWLQKLGRLPKGKASDNEFMEWGTILEAPVARKYSQKTGRRIRPVYQTLVHPQYPYMIGNPDRLQWDQLRPKKERRGILEVKATMFGNLKAWQTGGVPATYYLQLQHYLCLTGCSWGSFAVLFGGNKLVQFDVPRDEKLIQIMIQREADFWRLVETKTPPPMELSAEWNAQLAAFFPTAKKAVQITNNSPEAIGHLRRLLSLNKQIDKRWAEAEGHEAWLKAQIGAANAERLLIPGVGRVSWTLGERKQVDLEFLRREYPIAMELATKAEPQRRFSLKPLEEIKEEEPGQEEAEQVIYGARRIELD